MEERTYAGLRFQAENVAAGCNRSGDGNRTACAVPLGVLTRALTILLVIGVSRTSTLAQPADSPPQNVSGVEALKSLRAELEEASRVWITKYRAASSEMRESRHSTTLNNSRGQLLSVCFYSFYSTHHVVP